MSVRSALCCAIVLSVAAPVWATDKTPARKPAHSIHKAAATKTPKVVAKKASKAAARKKVDKAAAASATQALSMRATSVVRVHPTIVRTSLQPRFMPAPALHGAREVLACREGTEDRHARIAVVLVGGKPDSFAYYSKWKPRTCSIYLQRNRDASRWTESGSFTNVSTDKGLFMIEHGKSDYRFVFKDVDRERYCGMEGAINGTLTVRRGSERCEVAGIMEEGVPLGQAVAHAEAAAASSGATTSTSVATTSAAPSTSTSAKGETSFFRRLARRLRQEPSSDWHQGVIVGD